MSVFAEPLATLRRIVANVPFDPAEGLAALDLIEQRAADMLDEMEYAEGVLSRDPFDETQRWHAAEILRAVLSAREEATAVSENCPRGGTHARISHPGGRCIKCGASAREEAQIKTINPVSGAPYPNREDVNG